MKLELRAVHEIWELEYEKVLQSRTSIKKIAPYKLLIRGDAKKHFYAVENWLKKKAYRHLGAWLDAISTDIDIDYAKMSIRGQKSRWGSCSEDKKISLNYKLLFLPAKLVEHILIHELCHIRELNHSKRFWKLMASFDVNYKENQKLLRTASRYMPGGLC
jgi:predicted metal-dependent hydrolase